MDLLFHIGLCAVVCAAYHEFDHWMMKRRGI